jgi:hypothetical protein
LRRSDRREGPLGGPHRWGHRRPGRCRGGRSRQG